MYWLEYYNLDILEMQDELKVENSNEDLQKGNVFLQNLLLIFTLGNHLL